VATERHVKVFEVPKIMDLNPGKAHLTSIPRAASMTDV